MFWDIQSKLVGKMSIERKTLIWHILLLLLFGLIVTAFLCLRPSVSASSLKGSVSIKQNFMGMKSSIKKEDIDNQRIEISPFLNISIASMDAPRRNYSKEICWMRADSIINDQLGWELELIIEFGSVPLFKTSVLLRQLKLGSTEHYSADLVIPIELLKETDATTTISLRATLGSLIDTRDAHMWPNKITQEFNATLAPFVYLVWKHEISLKSCQQEDSAATRNTITSPLCGFIDGLEPGQGWWGDEAWLPEGKMGCQLAATPSQSKVLLLGDSQMRTSFQAMMADKCDEWSIMDYKQDGSMKSWCPRSPQGAANPDPREGWNITFCNGEFNVMGDGCWGGGAVWESISDGKMVYADAHSLKDYRYHDWDFIFDTNGRQSRTSQYDVVILATQLHDENTALGKIFITEPEKTQYGLDLLERLLEIQSWHSGPILCVGAWATLPKLRGKEYWWVAALTRADAFSMVSRSVVKKFDNVWYLDLIRPTMLYREYSRDGVHLFYPKPMTQIAKLLWHNVHILSQ